MAVVNPERIVERGIGSGLRPDARLVSSLADSLNQPVAILPTPRDIHSKIFIPNSPEVDVSSGISLGDYWKITPERERNTLTALAASLSGIRVSWVNATKDGGGVALMRAPQNLLLRQLGVDAHWFVAEPGDVATVTKKIHNTLQGVHNESLTDAELGAYKDWSMEIGQSLAPSLVGSHIVVIDDPQPTGLIPPIVEANPDVRIIFRDHIQTYGQAMSRPGTAQNEVWKFLRDQNGVGKAHLFVFHPVPGVVPDDVPPEKTVLMPPSTDHLDGLNRPLTVEEYCDEFEIFNQELVGNKQTPLDLQRPYITQIARFDPAKGIPDVLESYRLLRIKMSEGGYPKDKIPQLVITGNGATDDPDGKPMLDEAMRIRGLPEFAEITDDIKIARFAPHNDKLFNTILKFSMFILQLSTREGFEFKVTEGSMAGKAAIVSSAGGIPLQVANNETGYVVNPGDAQQVAEHMLTLINEPETLERLSKNALERSKNENHKFTTIPNLISWLHLIYSLIYNPNFKGNGENVADMVSRAYGI